MAEKPEWESRKDSLIISITITCFLLIGKFFETCVPFYWYKQGWSRFEIDTLTWLECCYPFMLFILVLLVFKVIGFIIKQFLKSIL